MPDLVTKVIAACTWETVLYYYATLHNLMEYTQSIMATHPLGGEKMTDFTHINEDGPAQWCTQLVHPIYAFILFTIFTAWTAILYPVVPATLGMVC